MIKLIESQRFLTVSIDGVNLLDMKHKLQNIRDEADRSQGGGPGGIITGKTLLGISPHNLGASHNESSHVTFTIRHAHDSRVSAIKLIRQATGLGLKEAKDLSDTSDTRGGLWKLQLSYPEHVFDSFKAHAPSSIAVTKD